MQIADNSHEMSRHFFVIIKRNIKLLMLHFFAEEIS